jgi:hypothetical protein
MDEGGEAWEPSNKMMLFLSLHNKGDCYYFVFKQILRLLKNSKLLLYASLPI